MKYLIQLAGFVKSSAVSKVCLLDYGKFKCGMHETIGYLLQSHWPHTFRNIFLWVYIIDYVYASKLLKTQITESAKYVKPDMLFSLWQKIKYHFEILKGTCWSIMSTDAHILDTEKDRKNSFHLYQVFHYFFNDNRDFRDVCYEGL